MVVWRLVCMESEAQCAMIAGISKMQMSCVVSLDSRTHPPLLMEQNTVQEEALSG